MESQILKRIAIISSIPSFGAASAILASKIGFAYGHSFVLAEEQSNLFIGIIGAVNNLATLILASKKEFKKSHTTLFVCHTFCSFGLFAVTALAAKVNLISTRLTLFGTLSLLATGFVSLLANIAMVKSMRGEMKKVNAGSF